MAQSSRHVCPKTSHGMLPFMIHNAAEQDKVQKVIDWLDAGGDVLATDMDHHTLVFTACENNSVEVLKALVARPDVHLNHGVKERVDYSDVFASPLYIACSKGNEECVEILLASDKECIKDIAPLIDFRVINKLIDKECWKCIEIILGRKPHFSNMDLSNLLEKAIKKNEVEIIKLILPQFSEDYAVAVNHLVSIYKRGFWGKVNAEEILKKSLPNNDFLSKILRLMADRRDWKRLEPQLQVLVDNVTINKNLVKPIVEKKREELIKLLTEKTWEPQDMNGAILVAAICGTSDHIIDILFSPTYLKEFTYSPEIVDIVLLLAIQNNHVGFLSILFKNYKFTYQILCRANKIANRNKPNNERDVHSEGELIKRALIKLENEILPDDGKDGDKAGKK